MSDNQKVRCRSCGAHWASSALLIAPNPFDPDETVHGCPQCKAVEDLEVCCDHRECWQAASCGTPTATGYRRTCYEHRPEQEAPE